MDPPMVPLALALWEFSFATVILGMPTESMSGKEFQSWRAEQLKALLPMVVRQAVGTASCCTAPLCRIAVTSLSSLSRNGIKKRAHLWEKDCCQYGFLTGTGLPNWLAFPHALMHCPAVLFQVRVLPAGKDEADLQHGLLLQADGWAHVHHSHYYLAFDLLNAVLLSTLSARAQTEMKRVVGDNATLPCHHQFWQSNGQSLDIEWILQKPNIKQRVIITFFNNEVYTNVVPASRLSFAGDYLNGDASLLISELQLSDSGEYHCKVKTGGKYHWSQVNLIVLGKPKLHT
ncbi:hypothetical protein NFI96_015501, partial [Prochilodus magdalenae]